MFVRNTNIIRLTSFVFMGVGCPKPSDTIFGHVPLRRLCGVFFFPSCKSFGLVMLSERVHAESHFLRCRCYRLWRSHLVWGFNVIRCSVLYTLWLHHIDRMMNGAMSDGRSIDHRATAYINLHLLRLCIPVMLVSDHFAASGAVSPGLIRPS